MDKKSEQKEYLQDLQNKRRSSRISKQCLQNSKKEQSVKSNIQHSQQNWNCKRKSTDNYIKTEENEQIHTSQNVEKKKSKVDHNKQRTKHFNEIEKI